MNFSNHRFITIDNDLNCSIIKSFKSSYPVEVEELKCEAPAVSNAQLSPNTATPTGTIFYVTCDAGYTLRGNEHITCLESGGEALQTEPPTCEIELEEGEA